MIIIRNQFHIAFYAAALAISISILLFTLLQKRTDKSQNRWFLCLLLIITLNSISEISTAVFEIIGNESDYNHFMLLASQNSYFILHTALCPALYNYVCSVTGKNRRREFARGMLLQVPFFITEFLAILNPVFNWVFYYDENLVFHRNNAELVIYWAAIFYFILSIFEILFAWKAVTKRKSIALIYFFFITFAGVYIQYKFIDIKFELLAEALALMGVMLAIESEDNRIDADTHIYNRLALQADLNNILTMNEKATIIFIKILNGKTLERITRSSNYDLLTTECAEFLKTLVPRYKIYHPIKETFIIICDKSDYKHIDNLTTAITNRFNNVWNIAEASIKLNAIVLKADTSNELCSVDDIMYISDSIIPSTIAAENIMDWILRRSEIEQAIKRNIINDNLEVYYQPTVYLDDYRIHGAEALLRMQDNTIGYISPEEFIPIAEQIGLVEHMDDFVLREVCRFIKYDIEPKDNIDCINVNLSVIQCLSPGFFEHIKGIVDEYGIDHSMINFEITETVGAEDYDVLSIVAHNLKAAGFSISMDDYGTGYSNMEGIFSLDFDVIKIDKTILWNAENDKRGKVILENTVKMIHDLDCKVLIEGVESEKHLNMLKKLNVDYLQGFYFAKPMPKSQFIEYLRK
ncbi:EAL domain, c-di-GMP-specific phosphodiesterase class I (or its enzymatically inactive variant) [Pseudobutyrivibrio ruminis]|uniref:EAL domain, c-di-GMP-specific phosphodiesterase class I (Or its enzymatically inactive variant) n=1 Tax=Pseudobutyrivibrio ruminis TaxID=46206 RepID=A0A1H7FZX6_9FIRM|nr:EAL domain-containing protein [Pseudobutyrivibrio ruminis]SEK28975.1 EAL domain, c-di-GMP-specific phosphodiesterase class I (or its enzymatically inactive variant) [Pseudobutyrivibrio ruminis]